MTCDTISDSLCVMRQVCTDTITVNRYITDSVTIEALKNSQMFYSTAFDSLLFKISIILCGIGILVAIVGIFLGIVKSNKEKEFDRLNKEFNKTKGEIEKVKKENLTMKEDIEEDRYDLIKTKDQIFREIANSYITSSLNEWNNENVLGHFLNLSLAFCIFNSQKIDPNEISFEMLKYLNNITFNHYKEKHLEDACIFLVSLLKFIEIYDQMDEKKIVKQAKELWNKLCSIFGGEDKVLKAIEDYKKEV